MTEYMITTAVGTGEKGFAGDGGPANAALLNGPFDVAFDPAGNLYFSDTFNNRIRRVDAKTRVISTVAGNGDKGYSGDGGPATAAALNEPYGIVLDRAGNIFIADRLNRRVRRTAAMADRRRAPDWPSRTASPSTPRSGSSTSPTSPTTGCG